jgi:hypothetical protein
MGKEGCSGLGCLSKWMAAGSSAIIHLDTLLQRLDRCSKVGTLVCHHFWGELQGWQDPLSIT